MNRRTGRPETESSERTAALRDAAVSYLELAVRNGFRPAQASLIHPDWDALRETAAFRELVD